MSVPVFFTKEDFYGRLLPGYATIILASYYFNFPRISNDISATILFIVEGPVIGYILCSITSFFYSIITTIGQKYDYKEFRKDYAKIRIKATERQISELDSPLSTYQFCISTGSTFILLSLLKIIEIYSQENIKFSVFIPVVGIFVVGILLLYIANYEHEDYHYTFWELHDEIIGSHKKSN